MQAYSWDERGYRDGYVQCLDKVSAVQAKVGQEQAKQLVQETLRRSGQ
jgi:hypothetical protein